LQANRLEGECTTKKGSRGNAKKRLKVECKQKAQGGVQTEGSRKSSNREKGLRVSARREKGSRGSMKTGLRGSANTRLKGMQTNDPGSADKATTVATPRATTKK
jgi:hypothetical protein